MTEQQDNLVNFVDANSADGCPVRLAAEIIEGKWTTRIIRELLQGTCRYSELQRNLSGISPKILTERLKMLEYHKLVSKKIYPTIPPKTEYSLTPLGSEMQYVIAAMAEFGIKMLNSR